MLHDLVRTAERLMGTESGFLYLVDRQTDELVIECTDGTSDEGAALLRRRRNIGDDFLTGCVALTGNPMIVPDLPSDPRTGQREFVLREHLKGGFLVPFYEQARVAGVLVLTSRSAHEFVDDHAPLVRAMCDQAFLSIEATRRSKRQRVELASLRAANEELRVKCDYLRRANAVADRFLGLATGRHGLGALATQLASLVHNPVIVQNQFLRVVVSAPSEATAEEDCFVSWCSVDSGANRAALSSVAAGHRSFRTSSPNRATPARIIAPIVACDEALGFVSVIELTRQLDRAETLAVECAARAMAIEMLYERTAIEVEMRLRADFLADLLCAAPGSEAKLSSQAANLGYDLEQPHRVVLIAVDDPPTVCRAVSRRKPESARKQYQLLYDLLSTRAPGDTLDYLAIKRSDALVLLVPVESCAAGSPLFDHIRARTAEAMPELALSIGVGSAADGLSEIHKSYEDARRALLFLKSNGRQGETIWSDRLELQNLLFSVHGKEDLARFVDRTIGRLIAYDRLHQTQLTASLDCYLRHSQNLRRAAKALHVHVNTLEYRLQRVRDIAQIDFDDPDARLSAELALRTVQCMAL